MRASAFIDRNLASYRLSVTVLVAGLALTWFVVAQFLPASLCGRVVAFGKPVAGATIYTYGGVQSGSRGDGTFDVPFSSYSEGLSVHWNGRMWWGSARRPLLGGDAWIDIDLGSAGASGTVTEADTGQPIEGAVVQLRGTIEGSLTINPVQMTDPRGSWFIGPLVSDEYRMEIEANGYRPASLHFDLRDGHFIGDCVVKLDR